MGDLIVGHGTTIAPDSLWAAVAALERTAAALRQVKRMMWLASTNMPHIEAIASRALVGSEQLAGVLKQCISAYSESESSNERELRDSYEHTAWWSGVLSRFGPVGAFAALSLMGLGWATQAQRGVRLGPDRLPVEATDDFITGALGLPRQFFHDPGGVSALLLGVATADSAVTVRRAATSQAAAPTSTRDLAERIPSGHDQIRIERYQQAGGTTWFVYVAGTATAAFGGREPFDMKSNLQAVGNRTAASQLAVERAMAQAGVKPSEPVVIVGHSQGGIIAARVAESGQFAVKQCVTFGAPMGTVGTTVPTLAIEHVRDPIPGLAGTTEPSDARVTVWADAPSTSESGPLADHAMRQYTQTAERIDRSGDPELQQVHANINALAAGAAEVSTWRAERPNLKE